MEVSSVSKMFLLSLAIGLFTGASCFNSVFQPGKKYIYSYEALMYTGASYPEMKQYAGSALKAMLEITENDEGYATFKLSDVRRGTINHTSHHINDVINVDYDKERRGGLQEELDARMEDPFIAHIEQGYIQHMRFRNDGDGEVETIHWRMSIAELFSADFYRVIDTRDQTNVENKRMEEGIGGRCVTTYSVSNGATMDELQVRKVRHYDRCSRRPHFFHSSIKGSRCSSEENRTYKAKGQVSYRIKIPQDSSVTIESVKGLGEITLQPFGSDGGTIESKVEQRLKLHKVEDAVPESLPKFDDIITKSSFSDVRPYETHPKIQSVEDLKKAHYYNRYHEEKKGNIFEEVEKDFPDKESDEKVQQEQFLKLINHFQRFSYDDLENFFSEHIDTRTANFRSQVAFGVLPFVGTNPAILFLLQKIEDGTLHPKISPGYVAQIPFHAKEPGSKLLEVFWNYLDSPQIWNTEFLYPSSWLAFGTLLNRGCVEGDFTPHSTGTKTYAEKDSCLKYLKLMIKTFHAETDPERQLLYLRAISNTRMSTIQTHAFLNDDVIRGKYSPLLRRQALLAALQLYEDHHEKDVQHTLYNLSEHIYLVFAEHSAVRMAAFEVMAKTVPSKEIAEKMVLQYILTEKNQQVKGFMYSTLEFLANSSVPCNHIYTSLYGEALKSVDPIVTDPVKQGFNKYYSYFNDNYNYGLSAHMQQIASNESVLPAGWYFSYDLNLLGYNLEKMEVGTYLSETLDLSDSLLNLMGKGIGNFGLQSWKHLHNVKQAPKSSYKEMETYMSQYKQDMLAFYWKKLLNSGDLTGGGDPYSTEELQYPFVKKTQLRMNFVLEEVEYGTVNELGIPVTLSLIAPSKATSDMTAKTNIFTHAVEIKWNVGAFSRVSGSVSVKSLYNPHGFRVNTVFTTRMPLKATFDIPGGNVEFHQSEPLDWSFEITPSTTNDHQESIIMSGEPFKTEQRIGHNYFGVGASISATVDPHWINDSALTSLKNMAHNGSDINTLLIAAGKVNWWDALLRPMAFSVKIEPCPENPTRKFKFGAGRNRLARSGLRDFKVGFDIDGVGPISRHWSVDFEFKTDEDSTSTSEKFSFDFARGPIPNYDSEKFEVCMNFSSNNDKQSLIMLEPMSRKGYPELSFNGRLKYGVACQQENATTINIKGSGQVSKENKNHVAQNRILYEERCQRSTKTEDIEYCLLETAKSGSLDEFIAVVTHTNIPKPPQGEVYFWIRQLFQSKLAIDTDFYATPIEDGSVTLSANLSSSNDVIEVSFVTPDNSTRTTHVTLHESLVSDGHDLTTVGRFNAGCLNWRRPTCYFSADHVSTFDEAEYNYKLDDKDYHVVMTHCQTQIFSVRIRSSHQHGIEMMINIGRRSITISPIDKRVTLGKTEGQNSNSPRHFADHEEAVCVTYTCTLHNDYGLVLLTVQKTDDSAGYYITSEQLMLNIFFNGKIGVVSTSDVYKSSLCGLCGQFNGEPVDDFMGPDRTIYETAEGFTNSYLTKP